MPMQVGCPCGQLLLASEDVIGKVVQCPNCRGLLKIPAAITAQGDTLDALDYDPLQDTTTAAAPLAAEGAAWGRGWYWPDVKPYVQLSIIGLVGLVCLGLTAWGVIYLWGFVPKYVLDEERYWARFLDEPVAVANYALRPPEGYDGAKLPPLAAPSGSEAWLWRSQNGLLGLVIRENPIVQDLARPLVSTTAAPPTSDLPGEPIYHFPGGVKDERAIHGIIFTRIAYDSSKGGTLASQGLGYRFQAVYIAFDGDRQVEVICACDESQDSFQFRVLEAAAQSLRPLDRAEKLPTVPMLPSLEFSRR